MTHSAFLHHMRFLSLPLLFLSSWLSAQVMSTPSVPYHVDWNTDGLIFGSGIVVAGVSYLVETNSSYKFSAEQDVVNKNDINPLERFVAGRYSAIQWTVSDITVVASFASPLFLLLDKQIRNEWQTVTVMYLEMGLFANSLPSLGKGSIRRFRPYVYGNAAPPEKINDADAARSFFSGHATRAFAAGVMTAMMYDDFFPDSKYSPYVWIASLSLASSCAILRVTSGAHFPSDVVVGAVVGSSIGYLIPYLHRNKSNEVTLTPLLTPQNKGITVSLRF